MLQSLSQLAHHIGYQKSEKMTVRSIAEKKIPENISMGTYKNLILIWLGFIFQRGL